MMQRKTGPVQKRIGRLLKTVRHCKSRDRPPLPHLPGDLLFAYWENTLDPGQRARIEEHAAQCDCCEQWLLEIGELFER